MILLDTNYLIRALVPDSVEAERVVDKGVLVIQSLLRVRVLPYNAGQATESAQLFKKFGLRLVVQRDNH